MASFSNSCRVPNLWFICSPLGVGLNKLVINYVYDRKCNEPINHLVLLWFHENDDRISNIYRSNGARITRE